MKKDLMSYCGEDILESADAYVEKAKAKRIRALRIVAAAAAAVIIAVSIPVGAFVASKKNKAPVPDETEDAVTGGITSDGVITMDNEITTVTETSGPSDALTVPEIDFYADEEKPTVAIHPFSIGINNGFFESSGCECIYIPKWDDFGKDGQTNSYIVGVRRDGAVSFEMVLMKRNDFDSLYKFEKATVEVTADEGMDLVSENQFTVTFEDGIFRFPVSFEYADGVSCGNVMFYIKYYYSNGDQNRSGSLNTSWNCARIDGYDIVEPGTDKRIWHVYESYAAYKGDFDFETYTPYYYYDPYMETYKDNPECRILRIVAEMTSTPDTLPGEPEAGNDEIVITGKFNGPDVDCSHCCALFTTEKSGLIGAVRFNSRGEFLLKIKAEHAGTNILVFVVECPELFTGTENNYKRRYEMLAEKDPLFAAYIGRADAGGVIDLGDFSGNLN